MQFEAQLHTVVVAMVMVVTTFQCCTIVCLEAQNLSGTDIANMQTKEKTMRVR